MDEQIRTPLQEEETFADAGTTEDAGRPNSIRSPCSAIIGNISSDDTCSPGPISSDRIGNYVTKLAASLNESFPFLPMGWRAERVGDEFILSPGAPVWPEDHEMENDDWSGERGWSPGPAMPTYTNSQ